MPRPNRYLPQRSMLKTKADRFVMSTTSSRDSRKSLIQHHPRSEITSYGILLTLSVYHSVEFPQDAITTLESHEHVKNVELDQEMKIQ